jgi:hypothetical protein
MKLMTSMLLVILLSSVIHSCAAEVVKAIEVKWDSIFGVNEDTEEMYCLVASGWMKAPRSSESDQVITNWLKLHTNATVTIVNQYRETDNSTSSPTYKYVWVQDETNSLNLHLVRTGCWPSGVMLDWKDSSPSLIDKSQFERLISDAEYNDFRKQLIAAEEYAKKTKLGIYSDGEDK